MNKLYFRHHFNMFYKRNNTHKVVVELHSAFADKRCRHCNKLLIEMVYINYNGETKQIESHPNRESVCCMNASNAIANTISRIFEQN